MPNVDTNEAPETWITAAPQDTVTTKDNVGRVIPPVIRTIPVIFHVYWAGSDMDGDVVGFYYAVVETLATPLPGSNLPPNLPGPKPQDYRFTTKTDSTFIFNVSEFSPDRQHAFYIYAVDDRGKPDPTPARFIFNATDRFPPIPIIDEASATGDIFRQRPDGSLFQKDTTYFVTDTLNPMLLTRQFVPVNSLLRFRWHAEQTSPQLVPTAFKYKLDEPNFIAVPAETSQVTYQPGAVGPGEKIFTLKALDQAGGARQTTRRFAMNLPPDTWLSGPDPNAPIWDRTRPKHRLTSDVAPFLRVTDWSMLPQIMGSLLSCDSIAKLPHERPYHQTFFEVWKDTLFVRFDGDTVHKNSWVILGSGGFDEDSPYSVRVTPIDPGLPDTTACPVAPVIRPGPANGSPVGFRAFVGTDLDPFGPFSSPSVTGLYPIFDPTDFRRSPRINSYQPMLTSGTIYSVISSEDGTGQDLAGLDKTVPRGNALKTWMDRIDGGGGNAEENLLRRKKTLKWESNFAPYLLTNQATFSPKPGAVLATRQVNLNLLADDDDPRDPGALQHPVGGPTANKIFRYTVSFFGQQANGRDTTIAPQDLHQLPAVNIPSYPIPPEIVSSNVDIIIELCDCRTCLLAPGQGKCIKVTIPVTAPAAQLSPLSANPASAQSGPGSSRSSRSPSQ